MSYDRTSLTQDDVATATATVRNNLDNTANMVMLDLGIPPGFELLSEDFQDYQEKTAGMKCGHLSKFSLTATQAILYFDSFRTRRYRQGEVPASGQVPDPRADVQVESL